MPVTFDVHAKVALRTVPSHAPNPVPIIATANGFFETVCTAYNHHHHLVLRPDDIWHAITIQFAAYLQGCSEELRQRFVNHSGKKHLCVKGNEFKEAPEMLAQLIGANLRDPSVRDWIVPSFSTTTENDRVIGSMILMASMKQYFSYEFVTLCGIPKITLEGTPDDWKLVEQKAGRLIEFDNGKQYMSMWWQKLQPVLSEFSKASMGEIDTTFWKQIFYYGPLAMSGMTYVRGWISVFFPFTHRGEWEWGTGHHTSVCSDAVPSGMVEMEIKIDSQMYKLRAGQNGYIACSQTAIQPTVGFTLEPIPSPPPPICVATDSCVIVTEPTSSCPKTPVAVSERSRSWWRCCTW
jgi:hypothetical protein